MTLPELLAALKERDEIIRNAEAAYRAREITAEQLAQVRRQTAIIIERNEQ